MSRNLFYAVMAGMMLFGACSSGTGFQISGTFQGGEGKTVYLVDKDDYEAVVLDSATVKEGKFSFTGRQDTACLRYLICERMEFGFFLENADLKIDLDKGVATGSYVNDLRQPIRERREEVNRLILGYFDQCAGEIPRAKRDSIRGLIIKTKRDFDAELLTFTKANIKNIAGASTVLELSDLPTDSLLALIDQVPPQYISPRMESIRSKYINTARTAVGKEFVDFGMNTADGKEVKLSELVAANQLTLVDFWASWCGPCRAEMPQLVETYGRFKDKGFGVVGISLDSKEKNWKDAITELGLPWIQLSDLKGWNSSAAKIYGINGIPATILINREGKIIGRGIQGERLNKVLEKMLN